MPDGAYLLFIATHAITLKVGDSDKELNDGGGWRPFNESTLDALGITVFLPGSRALFKAKPKKKLRRPSRPLVATAAAAAQPGDAEVRLEQ